ncbi:MAG: hypothetical protein RIS52_1597 [Pseudomonadota bacterium]
MKEQKARLQSLTAQQRNQIDSRLLAAHFDLMPTAVFGNIVNAVLVLLPFATTVAHELLALIFASIIGAAVILLRFWKVNHAFSEADTPRLLKRAVWVSALVSVIWGVSIYSLMANSSLAGLAMLGMLTAGMMAAATLTCATVPNAARAFVAPLAVSALAAFIQRGGVDSWVTIALLISFVAVINRSIGVVFENHLERLIGQVQLTESAQAAEENAATVRLLLNDFEEHGSDWLWEVDEDGKLLSPSARFAQAAERPMETLIATPLIGVFNTCPERDILEDHLHAARSFRDITVPLTVGGVQRWWSLSGHPFKSSDGRVRLRGVCTDISAAKNAEVKVAYMAHYDGLTDLPNRFLFNDTINRALNRQKIGSETGVLSLDLDHFKSVNDTLGHPAGDALLQVVSRRIEACLGTRDVVARMGGDEFAVLVTGVKDRATVANLAKRILIELNKPIEIEGHQLLSAASIGIALAPADGTTPEMLMKNVDLALYSAKADGRNRFAFFDASMDEAAQIRRTVEIDLRAAMSRDELTLHYQPLINVETGETAGYEALLRWHHPERGLVMPNDFVPIAEETGLIVQLGEWVIRNAIAEAAGWPEHLGISINLSPLQMKSGSLITTIINAIASAQIAPGRVEFEITETVLMQESEVNLATLHRLRDIGVKIALDDFGTGYSSLNYLRSFPFDKIKIDRCFVEDVDSREDCRAIIRAVTGLASSLGMVTTAEGVENSEQLERLRAEGCTQVQGFLFSKAVPVAELTNLRATIGPATEKSTAKVQPIFLPPADLPSHQRRDESEATRKRA